METTMFDTLKMLLANGEYTVAESFTMQSSEAIFLPIPKFLFDSRIGLHLYKEFDKKGLWSHQALALERIGDGKNVVVSTGTASGKSMIFRAAAFHKVLLDSESRVLVFYPLKALATDQLRGWRALAKALGLPQEVVGRIDGTVAFQEREKILASARILIMTPDVCHAWLMSRLSIPLVKDFLRKLGCIVMDEAHTLEGVFGSNFAFLLRRMFVARRHLLAKKNESQVQVIAATATIENPSEHMKVLTGMDFESVSDDNDGSPRAERFCVHVISPAGEEMYIAQKIQSELLKQSSKGGFITFVDSRKGVEVLARSSQNAVENLLGDEAVMPYRAGYDNEDRERIEQRLQDGGLRGVVSTSALELGIDLPHLAVGINIGVPPTRKSYLQRIGRVGRSNKGVFLVIASHNAFKGYGTSFKEYHHLSVEPSHLYLDNRFMQFAQSRCLADEMEALGAGAALSTASRWPDGFREIYAAAKPGGNRPPEFDSIAQLGGDAPQRSYPLRNVGELNLKIARGEHADELGEVNESQALRECYPGAAYIHMGRTYRVMSWNTHTFEPFIKVKPTSPNYYTTPRIKTWINTGITPNDLMDQNLLFGENGFIAECRMQITEKVEGYVDQAGVFHAYQELRQRNPNMRPRQRNFRTSGVIICIKGSWFRKRGVKQSLADWVSKIFCREYSILPQDIGVAATNISVRTMDGGRGRGDCLVLFDQTYGSLRLTERLYLNFRLILERLRVAAESIEDVERVQLLEYVSYMKDMYAKLEEHRSCDIDLDSGTPPQCLQAFTSGSLVFFREAGKIGTDVEIVQPTWMDGQLMYQVKSITKRPGFPVKQWVAAHALEPSANADAWSIRWWNAETEEFIDVDEEL